MTHVTKRNTKRPRVGGAKLTGATAWGLALAMALALGCSSKDHDDEGGATSGATCPSGSTLTYENFGKAFMTAYCVSCHSSTLSGAARAGAPSDHNFDTLANIKSTEAAHIDAEAAAGPSRVNADMPPAGSPKPSDAERLKLGEWLACGTP